MAHYRDLELRWEDMAPGERFNALTIFAGQVLASIGFGWAFGWAVGLGVFGIIMLLLAVFDALLKRR